MLEDLSVKDFANAVASYEPVFPAGGCVVALSGLLGVSLLEMAVNSAYEHPTGSVHQLFFSQTKERFTELHRELLTYIEKDAVAYGGLLSAYKLPRATPTEVASRRNVIQAAALSAIEIPLQIALACVTALESGVLLLPKVKQGVLGDLQIGLLMLKASAEGSLAAAKTNLPLIHGPQLVSELTNRIEGLQTQLNTAIAPLG